MRTHLVAATERGSARTGFVDRTGAVTPCRDRALLLDEVSAARWAEILTRREIGWLFTSVAAPEEMVAADVNLQAGDVQ